jgi:poly-gamma-glutamate capsule biosynthesis protein CapA/YwtB (metallophosphatase superfamily)
VDPRHERFAHRLVDGGVDLVHGHSSHHPRPLEVYRGHLILYGCGELVDDYEGIGDPGSFRADHVVLWFPTLRADGTLAELRLVPLRICKLRPVHLRPDGVKWVGATLDRISRRFGARVHVEGAELAAAW